MTDQIDAAVAEAEAAAANMEDTRALTPAAQAGALATPAAGAVDMSLSGFLKAGGIQPDIWLTLEKTGIKLDKQEKAVFDDFEGTIDFSRVKLFQGLRTKLPGNKFSYIKTYDGRTEARSGENWATAVANAQARAIEPAETYRGADILIVTTKEITQGAKKYEVGKKIGYTTAVTGFAPFQSLLETLVNKGDVQVGPNDSLTGEVKVKVQHIVKSNTDFQWGILGFEQIA